ncbi:MAG: hypothetical protein M3R72_09815 [Bacteroidota bacterium]|nr:hypothetical protein [Bacteroidota bacterium]
MAPFTLMNKEGIIKISHVPPHYRFLQSNAVEGACICGYTSEDASMFTKKNDSPYSVLAVALVLPYLL